MYSKRIRSLEYRIRCKEIWREYPNHFLQDRLEEEVPEASSLHRRQLSLPLREEARYPSIGTTALILIQTDAGQTRLSLLWKEYSILAALCPVRLGIKEISYLKDCN